MDWDTFASNPQDIAIAFKEYTREGQITVAGFYKYLLDNVEVPIVMECAALIESTPELIFLISKMGEAFLIEGMIDGSIKAESAKFLLKNEFGYSDAPPPPMIEEARGHEILLTIVDDKEQFTPELELAQNS